MIKRQTVLDSIEITRNGLIQIRIAFELIENGIVISNKVHRTTIDKTIDIDKHMEILNSHITGDPINEMPISASEIERIKAIILVV